MLSLNAEEKHWWSHDGVPSQLEWTDLTEYLGHSAEISERPHLRYKDQVSGPHAGIKDKTKKD